MLDGVLERDVEFEHTLQIAAVAPDQVSDVDKRPREPPFRRRRFAPLFIFD